MLMRLGLAPIIEVGRTVAGGVEGLVEENKEGIKLAQCDIWKRPVSREVPLL